MKPRLDATETAQVIASLVPVLDEQTARDLHRLLGLNLSAPSSAALREGKLGLLIEMIDHTGTVPSGTDYDALRRERIARGERWPDRATLIRAFGHWLGAVKAAMRHFHETRVGKAAVPSSNAHGGRHRSYSRAEILAALELCRSRLGPWPTIEDGPTEWEYLEWARLTRRAARLGGKPDPRLPGREQIRKKCGSYDRAAADCRGRRRRALGS